ncbi:hypothetical protein BAUCODRAFT_120774 [Baudoinia panamericana UAMH 10762]|uniref:Uncharacterized protein n=1 Tax=Baudoinia panamericana (strain UAMH 10762) TaxID=717646 RepID=M2NF17_BAUPA|nr:uncharacterized protein BAUCODRAFT_120774 [Baudoinia panamericana UAMH 10762]EMC97849.1 hypothetical protein BAUCODRAFT_120774 [Baudoinia panamericana UAMH 10762]
MPNVLLAGLHPQWLQTATEKGYDIGSTNQSSNIAEEAKQMMADLRALQSVKPTTHMFNPDDDSNLEAFMTLLGSEKFDGVSLGGGVRTIPQLGDYFTNLVNEVVRKQPGAKLLFPLTPKDIVPAIKKYLL